MREYVTDISEEIYEEMVEVYETHGRVLEDGSKKQQMLSVIAKLLGMGCTACDHAMRMATVSDAVVEYLDAMGAMRGCKRMTARKAVCTAAIYADASAVPVTLPSGFVFTDDSGNNWVLEEELKMSYEGRFSAEITAQNTGAHYYLDTGDILTPVNGIGGIEAEAARPCETGGDEESDEKYRERILAHPLYGSAAGTEAMYESLIRGISTAVDDVSVRADAQKNVVITVLVTDLTKRDAIIRQANRVMMTSDFVSVFDKWRVRVPTPLAFRLLVHAEFPPEMGDMTETADRIVREYNQWQTTKLGRDFAPDRLTTMLINAGAVSAAIDSSSRFNDGEAVYTEVNAYSMCRGAAVVTIEAAPSAMDE